MTAQQLMERLQAERGTEVLIDGRPIVRVDMPYGGPITLSSRRSQRPAAIRAAWRGALEDLRVYRAQRRSRRA